MSEEEAVKRTLAILDLTLQVEYDTRLEDFTDPIELSQWLRNNYPEKSKNLCDWLERYS